MKKDTFQQGVKILWKPWIDYSHKNFHNYSSVAYIELEIR